MPKITPALTDTKIKSEISKHKKDGIKSIKLSDGQGLYLYIDKAHRTYWRFDYTAPITKKRNTLSIGTYPEISLQQARLEREKFRKQLAQNLNPQHERKKEQQQVLINTANTVQSLGLEFIQIENKTLKASTVKRNENTYQHLFACLGHYAVADLKAKDILSATQHFSKDGKDNLRKKIHTKLSQILRYAMSIGVCERNVAMDLVGLVKAPKVKHYHAITEPAAFGQLLRDIDTLGNITPIVRLYLQILPLVFVRSSDLRYAKWQDIDFEQKQWRFTPSKTENEHEIHMIVPLSRQVLALFKQLYPFTGHKQYCFAMTNNVIKHGAFYQWAKTHQYFGKATAHGFRATARTLLDEVLKYPIEHIEQQLGHQVRDFNGRAYNRTSYLDERTEMMQAWADYCDELKQR